jgi:hypothetical protein
MATGDRVGMWPRVPPCCQLVLTVFRNDPRSDLSAVGPPDILRRTVLSYRFFPTTPMLKSRLEYLGLALGKNECRIPCRKICETLLFVGFVICFPL